MASYWERQAEARRQRSLSAQAARYQGQAGQLSRVGQVVGRPPVQPTVRTNTGGTSAVLAAHERRRAQQEAERVRNAERAQAEARAAQARREAEARAAAEEAAAQARLAEQYSTDLFAGSGTGRDQRVAPPTPAEQAQSRANLESFVFGPERESVLPGRQQAGRFERVLRDWGLSEQEFRLAGERAGERRFGAAAGWAGLGLAGAVPFVGDVAQGAARAYRLADFADARRVARVSPRPSVGGPREASAFPRAVEYPDQFVPQDFPAFRQVRTVPAPGSRQRGAGTILDLDSARGNVRLFHGTDGANVSSILETGIRPSTAGDANGLFASPELATAARYGSDGRKSYVVEFVTKPENVVDYSMFPGLRHFVVDEVSSPQIAAVHVFDYSGAGPARITDSYILNPEYGSALEDFGVLPRLGTTNPLDVPTEFQLVEELGRGVRTPRAGQAADVGRVSGRPIIRDVVSEIGELGSVRTTKPNIQSIPAERQLTAELAYRQGYENLPRVVDSAEFNSLAGRASVRSGERLPFEYQGPGRDVVIYRGFVDDASRSGQEYASELLVGEYRISPGDYGPGIYFGSNPEEVLAYSARVGGESNAGGSIVRAILPDDAKMLDFSNSAVYREFDASPFKNLSEFAVANGYDGIVIPRSPNPADNYIVVLNRSILTFDQPRVVSPADAARVASGELPAKSLLDNLFADAGRGAEAADVGRAADVPQSFTPGPLPNRARQILDEQPEVVEAARREFVERTTRLTEYDRQQLAAASPAVRQMNPDNIWVIHETQYPPQISGSDVNLRPTGDFTPETGRSTIHFSLNHTVAGHEMRATQNAPYVVAARLSDVLEANPGALDNLYSVDTFFTPAPGQPLRLPNARVLENSSDPATQNAIRQLIEDSGGTTIAGGKRESATVGVDSRIRELAGELGAPSVTHDAHPLYIVEMAHAARSGMGTSDPMYYLPLMSDNARARTANDNIWTNPSREERRFRVEGDEDV